MEQAAQLVLRILIGALLTYAAIAKWRGGPVAFMRAVTGYQLLPRTLASRVAMAIPPAEFFSGLALGVGVLMPWSALMAAALIAVFTVAIAASLARGLRAECGCGGVLAGPVRGHLVARNLSLLAALAFVISKT
jgi:uncharacterized membrane protein YphA (DoxX/SURF4 family)